MAEENAKHAVVEEMADKIEEQIAPPTRWQRFKNWAKAHTVQIAIGAGAAALTGVGFAVKKVVKDRTGLDLGEEIAETVEEVIPTEI